MCRGAHSADCIMNSVAIQIHAEAKIAALTYTTPKHA
jgi:hypothetical protein